MTERVQVRDSCFRLVICLRVICQVPRSSPPLSRNKRNGGSITPSVAPRLLGNITRAQGSVVLTTAWFLYSRNPEIRGSYRQVGRTLVHAQREVRACESPSFRVRETTEFAQLV
jgi:hypothetical protein